MAAGWYRWDGADLILHVRVQPRAGRDEWLEPRADRMQLRIAAPPVDGKANEALLRILAQRLAIPRQQISLKSGQTSRQKVIEIESVTAERLATLLT